MLNVTTNPFMLSLIFLNVIMPNAVMLNVIWLSVVAPAWQPLTNISKNWFLQPMVR
jgi:hypothetical protein